MIQANLYETEITRGVAQYTKKIPDIPITNNIFTNAYWLGWINYDNIPSTFHASQYVITDTDISMVDVTEAQNCDYGITSDYYSGTLSPPATNGRPYNTSYDLKLSKWTVNFNQDTTGMRLMNNGTISSMSGYPQLYFAIFLYSDEIPSNYRRCYNMYFKEEINTKIILEWLQGNITLTLISDNNNVPGEFPVTANDFEYGYYNGNTTINGIENKFAILMTAFSYENNRDRQSDNANPYSRSLATLHMFFGDKENVMALTTTCSADEWNGKNYDQAIGFSTSDYSLGSATFYTNDGKYILGGYVFTVSKNFISSGNNGDWIFNGNSMVYLAGSGRVWVYRCFKPIEALFFFSMFPRLQDSNNNEYGFSDNIFVPYFTENNEVTGTFLNGNLDEIKSQLRPWQYELLTDNGYTENDKPIYTPDGDDDKDSGGDDIRGFDFTNTIIGGSNNFITQYALTQSGLTGIGKSLWAKLSDNEFWETVGTVTKNDASINPADMMKYFTSLRFFPFDLSIAPNVLSTGIYMGRAVSALTPPVGTPFPRRLLRNIITIDGGNVTVPRMYNDFRDYEPCCNVQVTVPYCGSVTIPASEVMGKTLYLKYNVDLQTGSLIAVIEVSSDTYYVIATLAGTCGASIPITANNNIEFLQRIATVGQAIFSGGASGANTGAEVGNYLGGEVGAVTTAIGAVTGSITSGVGALAGLPPVTVHKQGYASGFSLYGGVNRAYITIIRQKYEIPDNYGHTVGHATSFMAKLGTLRGLTVCSGVDTTGIPCNESEREEIKSLLEGGIYV